MMALMFTKDITITITTVRVDCLEFGVKITNALTTLTIR